MANESWVQKVWLEVICDEYFIKHCLLTCEGKRKIEQLSDRQFKWPSTDSHSGDIIADVVSHDGLDYDISRVANFDDEFMDGVCDELHDFIIECVETEGDLCLEDALLTAVLGISDYIYHSLPFTTSFVNNNKLVLYASKSGKAYLLFENENGRGLPYSGRFKEFLNINQARDYINKKFTQFRDYEFAILKSIYRDIELNRD